MQGTKKCDVNRKFADGGSKDLEIGRDLRKGGRCCALAVMSLGE